MNGDLTDLIYYDLNILKKYISLNKRYIQLSVYMITIVSTGY